MRSTFRWEGGFILLLAFLPLSVCAATPNIVIILADDLGYGDVRCYNPERGKIATPHIDGLAAQGLIFTDAHSSSSICSPSRYTLLTGQYHWRTRLRRGNVANLGPPLIPPERPTLGSLAGKQGYRTAAIGKWHLGWDWPVTPEQRPHIFLGRGVSGTATAEQQRIWREVFSQRIANGPSSRGFDTYFGIDAPSYPPYCFIENDRTIGIPGSLLPAAKLTEPNSTPVPFETPARPMLASLGGPALDDWDFARILPALVDRSTTFIRESARAQVPFLLYFALTTPHPPHAPNPEWRGKSGLGVYGDLVMETDAAVGSILDALKGSGCEENTIVIFTSDNGCATEHVGLRAMEAEGHFPSGIFRGYKASPYEGGHRIPFIVRWLGVVRAGMRSSQLVHHADIFATIRAIRHGAGHDRWEDGMSLLPLFKAPDRPLRTNAVSGAADGTLTLRHGLWKLIASSPAQLYDLSTDPAEANDVAAANPKILAEMEALLLKIMGDADVAKGVSQP